MTHPTVGCTYALLLGDGYCDDEANVPECDFDGGDCCAEETNNDYCQVCQCFDDENGTNTTDQTPINTTESCPYPAYIGDGYCDDVTNIAACDFDGGDCCLDEILVDYCQVCQCLDGENNEAMNQ